MVDVWICNSSPLISLARVGRLNLIEALAHRIIVPAGDVPARCWQFCTPGQQELVVADQNAGVGRRNIRMAKSRKR